MIADLSWFNESEYDMPDDFAPIPEGKYLCALTASEEKDTKAGTGKFLELKFQVIDGKYKGRNLWDRLNLINKSKEAEKISRSKLKALCRAVKVPDPNNSADLHNIPLLCQVNVTKRSDTGGLTNEIRGYFKKDQEQTVPPEELHSSDDTAPWEK